MIKTIQILCAALVFANVISPKCNRSAEVGNYINYLHLFKEEADTLLSFYNAKTSVELIFENIVVPATGTLKDHKVAFRVTDSNFPEKKWIYLVWAKIDKATNIIIDIYNFGKFRSLPNNNAASTPQQQFPDLYLIRYFFKESAANLATVPCTNCMIKMEYDHFYYLYANYYKDGTSALAKPLCCNGSQ